MADALKTIIPFGRNINDGYVQIICSLPVLLNQQAYDIAIAYAQKMGVENATILSATPVLSNVTQFIIEGRCKHVLDAKRIKPQLETNSDFYKNNTQLKKLPVQALPILCIDFSDKQPITPLYSICYQHAKTGDWGLNTYSQFKLHTITEHSIDTIQTILNDHRMSVIILSLHEKPRSQHIKQVKKVIPLLHMESMPAPLIILHSETMTHAKAKKLNCHAGFDHNTKPAHIADFIIHAIETNPELIAHLIQKPKSPKIKSKKKQVVKKNTFKTPRPTNKKTPDTISSKSNEKTEQKKQIPSKKHPKSNAPRTNQKPRTHSKAKKKKQLKTTRINQGD